MGSTEVHRTYHQPHLTDSSSYQLFTGRVDEDGFSSFQVLDLADNQDNTLLSLADEVVLLSWFLTLLRTRENTSISFNWAYNGLINGYKDEQQIKLFTQDGLMTSMKDTVRAIAATIFSRLEINAEKPRIFGSNCASLILSTTPHTTNDIEEQVRQTPVVTAKALIILGRRCFMWRFDFPTTIYRFVHCTTAKTCCNILLCDISKHSLIS